MNGTKTMALGLCNDLTASAQLLSAVTIIICPPATLLAQVSAQLSDSNIKIGIQDIDQHDAGAHTGQISAMLAKDAGATYTILGHCERRISHFESSPLVAAKVTTALAHQLTPIICLGETLQQRQRAQTENILAEQLDAVIKHCGLAAFNNAIIAYEPVWAIGSGLAASPEQAQQAHQFIRDRLAVHDNLAAAQCRIIYGGSMQPENAAELMAQPDIDGGLIGAACLKSQDFLNICTTANVAVDRS